MKSKLFNLKNILLTSLLFSSLAVNAAQVVVISDIDDTIKRSHILGVTKGVGTAFRSDPDFAGMAELYQQIETKYTAMDKSISFFYVSNAPDVAMRHSHEFMISLNKFPQGEFKLARLTEKNHKENVIPQIIDEEKPETVIFIGDNGENDVYVYDNMTKKYSNSPEIDFITYIRIAYLIEPNAVRDDKLGKPLQAEQIGFASAGEIAVDLFAKGLLELPVVQKVVESTLDSKALLLPELGYDATTNLPYWYDCRSHKIIELSAEISQDAVLQNHNSKFTHRCSQTPKSKLELGVGTAKSVKRVIKKLKTKF